MKLHEMKAIVADRKKHMGDVSAVNYILIALAKYGPMKIIQESRTPILTIDRTKILASAINITALGQNGVTEADGSLFNGWLAQPGATHKINEKGEKRINKYRGTAAWDYV